MYYTRWRKAYRLYNIYCTMMDILGTQEEKFARFALRPFATGDKRPKILEQKNPLISNEPHNTLPTFHPNYNY